MMDFRFIIVIVIIISANNDGIGEHQVNNPWEYSETWSVEAGSLG